MSYDSEGHQIEPAQAVHNEIDRLRAELAALRAERDALRAEVELWKERAYQLSHAQGVSDGR